MVYFPKMLVICHNLLEETNNIGKTLLSFIKDWPKEQLYSLYFAPQKPFSDRCAGYYQICDKEVLKATLKKSESCGHRVVSETRNAEIQLSDADSFYYRFGNKRFPIVSYARDIIWKKGAWKNPELDGWIEEVNPEVIFFIPNDYELAFHVLQYVKSKCTAPVITFYTDDSFYYGQKNKGIDRIRRNNLRLLGKMNASLSRYTFTTCSKMSREYAEYLKSEYYEIGNSIDIYDNSDLIVNKLQEEIRVSYIGNLHSNRWINVLDVGNAIESLNNKGLKYRLHVFSGSDLPTSVMEKLNNCKGIKWEGKINNRQVRQEQINADILLHVEAFDEKSRKSTRLSVSTKIFEYLYAGKIILGYGPSDVASMEFLNNIGYSVLCSEKTLLENSLQYISDNFDSIAEVAAKGTEYAIKNFDKNKAAQRFHEIVLKAYQGG